jgi:hypothetical protein
MNPDQPLNLDSSAASGDRNPPESSPDRPDTPTPSQRNPSSEQDPIPLSLGNSGRSPQPSSARPAERSSDQPSRRTSNRTGDQTSSRSTLMGDRSPSPSPEQRVADLRREEQRLRQEIDALQASYHRMMREQVVDAQRAMGRVIQDGLAELEQRKQTLQVAVEQLERRQERIKAEMRTSFAGVSQDLAIRVQGFKDYLVGSLQDLATAAEQLELQSPTVPPSPSEPVAVRDASAQPREAQAASPTFADSKFQAEQRRIRELLDRYRTTPDYYGPPWQLRRTFEPVHAERVSKWFFEQGGRGALRSIGSRLQNILISSAITSVLNVLYGDRTRVLVLANSPERLGEWRRGLQDCLGISRADFGSEQGVVLFESAEPLAQRADRILRQGDLPFIIIDEAEEQISLSVLEFPLWLAFAPDPNRPTFY